MSKCKLHEPILGMSIAGGLMNGHATRGRTLIRNFRTVRVVYVFREVLGRSRQHRLPIALIMSGTAGTPVASRWAPAIIASFSMRGRESGRSATGSWSSDVRTIYLLLSHTHWDHINGLPFFRPAYDPRRRMHILAGHLKDQGLSIEGVLNQQMREPVFPVPLDAMKAIVECEDFEAGDAFELFPGVRLRTAALNHPNGATGYRIEHAGKSVCYITDTEHVPGQPE